MATELLIILIGLVASNGFSEDDLIIKGGVVFPISRSPIEEGVVHSHYREAPSHGSTIDILLTGRIEWMEIQSQQRPDLTRPRTRGTDSNPRLDR